MKLRDITDEPVESLEQLIKVFKTLKHELSIIKENVRILKEDDNADLDWHAGPMFDLVSILASTQQRMEAARRGLGIANKLPAGPYRTKHLRRIMVNLNRIRAAVTRLQRIIAAEADAAAETV